MRGKRNLPIFVGYAVAALFVLGYLAQQMGGEFFLRPTLHIRAVFASGSQLVAGDDVLVSGVPVGRISAITAGRDGAVADLLIHKEYGPIKDDARAVIRAKNLLGETYVELSRGIDANAIPDGGVIPLDHTLTPVELSRVLQALDPTVRDHLVLLINTLGSALAGNGANLNTQAGDVRQLADDLEVIATTLVNNQQHLDSLIVSLSKILDTLAQYRVQFRQLVADWDRLMQELLSRETDLQGFFRQQARVMAIFDSALAGQGGNLHAAIAEAPQTVDNLNQYLNNANQIYGGINPEVPDINSVFDHLASAFSATDAQNNHYWRVYCVGGPFPNPPPSVPETPCFQPGGA